MPGVCNQRPQATGADWRWVPAFSFRPFFFFLFSPFWSVTRTEKLLGGCTALHTLTQATHTHRVNEKERLASATRTPFASALIAQDYIEPGGGHTRLTHTHIHYTQHYTRLETSRYARKSRLSGTLCSPLLFFLYSLFRFYHSIISRQLSTLRRYFSCFVFCFCRPSAFCASTFLERRCELCFFSFFFLILYFALASFCVQYPFIITVRRVQNS